MSLREITEVMGDRELKIEINAILHKMVHRSRQVVLGREHNGWRIVNVYRWRLPSDGA